MAGVKGPRPCLGLLGKGDWPLSTRAYPHRDTHLLTYTCWHTCNRPSTNSAASSSLFLSGRLLPSFAPSSSIAVLRSQNPALSRYELLCTRASAPACTSMHRVRVRVRSRSTFIFGSIFLALRSHTPFYDLPDHFASHSIPEDELTSNPIESMLLCSTDVASILFGYLKPFISSGDSKRRFMGRPKRLSRFGRLWSDVFVESSIDALFESYRSRCYRTTDIDEFRRDSKVQKVHVIF